MFRVTVVITTKNRKNELDKCLTSCYSLTDVDEILVFDDGSTDNTYEFIKDKYPDISLYRSEKSLGIINARTKCAALAMGDIIFSVDDDCVFQDKDTINETIRYFNKECVAAITIPIINVYENKRLYQKGIGGLNEVYIVSQFMGGAHAMKKDVFLKMGGYYNNLIRQEEETELAMRLYNSGYVIRIANCTNPILHHHSSNRNNYQISFYRARNQTIVNYKMAPLILFSFVVVRQLLYLFIYELKRNQLRAYFAGIMDALKEIILGKITRTPMSVQKFIRFKKMRRKGFKRIENG